MKRNRFLAFILAILVTLLPQGRAFAQSGNVPIIRDAEIENLLQDYAYPLLKAAGLRRDRIDIVIVNSKSFNAFVSGRKIFINVGALVQAETPNELIGVLAHEIGHMAGGHQDRLRQQIDRAQTIATVTAVIGIGALVASAKAGNGEAAKAGAGLAAGGVEIAKRGLLAYQRTEELTADRSAVEYLDKTGQSARGLITTFERFQKDLMFRANQPDPYKLSHPLPRERLSALEDLARKSPNFEKRDPPALQARHDRARAKIAAYLYGPSASDDIFRSNPGSQAAKYGKAIATFLYRNPRDAYPLIDGLIRSAPSDPYYHEIKGEVALKAGDANGAAAAFGKAVELSRGQAPSIQVALGHALVLTGTDTNMRRAIGELEVAIALDPVNVRAYQMLAMAYGRLGETGNAELATAEARFHAGNYKEAKQFAARAKSRFDKNSPQWLRADDIQQFEAPKR